MPRFEPFHGLRYAAGADLSAVVCPPYDVIDGPERDRLVARSPHNAVHVEMPVSRDGEDPYAGAAALFHDWREETVLARDSEPHVYAYRMSRPGDVRSTLGYIGALGVTDEDGLLPHEQTTPKAKSDRLDLLRATRMNTSPIWALSLAPGVSSIWKPSGDPVGTATDDAGVLHEMWMVPAEAADRITRAIAAAPVSVADGHHRWETARNYMREHPDDAAAERVLALVVELSEDELQVRPIHRLIGSLRAGVDLPEGLSPWFEPARDEDQEVVVVTANGEVGLRALPATRQAAPHDADAERIQIALDGLGIDELTYPHEAAAVREAVSAGQAAAGILCRAVSADVIASAARAGERFPPKTTFFWPKPLTGFVFRSLDG
ncbi:MAG: DUF1015 domain-containing protein [Actinobacteria bacterium]|nr:DUF1015 domain-containing protein [Actinomycetota bacterium]